VARAESLPLVAPRRSGMSLAVRAGWRQLALCAGVFVVSLLVLGWEARSAPFEADEADYVATSRYFGYLFLQHDVGRSEWASNHWTRTQPPLTRYIIGAWLTASGRDLETLNQPYVSTASSFEVNRRKGRVPDDDVLALARQPMVVLGAGAVTAIFAITALLAGPIAGLVAAALALSSPFLRYTFVHAWAEAPLACFMLLAAWLAAFGPRRIADGQRWLWPAVGLGVALGLASASKLTGLVGVAAVLAGAALLGLVVWRRGTRAAMGSLAGWSALSAVVALAIFVVVNPYLWRGPASGLLGMLEERRDEMAFQQEQWPEFAVLTVQERPWLTAVGSTRVGPWAEFPLVAVPFGLVFGVIGLIGVMRRDWRRSAPLSGLAASSMLVVWLVMYTAAILAGLGLSYPRYFLPACLLLLPFVAAGLTLVASYLVALVDRRHLSPRRSETVPERA
jgi:hypothetical protein